MREVSQELYREVVRSNFSSWNSILDSAETQDHSEAEKAFGVKIDLENNPQSVIGFQYVDAVRLRADRPLKRFMGTNVFRIIGDVLPSERWLILGIDPSSPHTVKVSDKAFLEDNVESTSCESIGVAISNLGRAVEWRYLGYLLAEKDERHPRIPYVKPGMLNKIQYSSKLGRRKTWGHQWIKGTTLETMNILTIAVRNLTSSFS